MGQNICYSCMDIKAQANELNFQDSADHSNQKPPQQLNPYNFDISQINQQLDIVLQQFLSYYRQNSDSDSFQILVNKPQCLVSSRQVQQGYIIKYQYPIPFDPDSLLNFISNVQNRTKWDKNVKSSKILYDSPEIRITHTIYKGFLTISPRESMMASKKVEIDGCVIDINKSVTTEAIPVQEGNVRVQVYFGGYHYQRVPKDEKGTVALVTGISLADFGFTPALAKIARAFTATAMPRHTNNLIKAVSESLQQMESLSGELILVTATIVCVSRFKKYFVQTESFLRKLKVFIPPPLEEYANTGEDPQKLVMSTSEINDEFTFYSKGYSSTEILVSMNLIIVILVVSQMCLEWIGVSYNQNLSFSLAWTAIWISIWNFWENIFDHGRHHPENKVAGIYSFVAVVFTGAILYYDHHTFFDFNFHLSLKLFNLQATSAFYQFWKFSCNIPYVLFAVTTLFSVYLIVFALFKYIARSTINMYASRNLSDTYTVKQINRKMIVFLFLPVILSLIWVKPLKNLIVGNWISQSTFQYFRIVLFLLCAYIRFGNIRNEAENLLNQNKTLIISVFADPSPVYLKRVTQQCKIIISKTWEIACMSICIFSVIALSAAMLGYRGNLGENYPQESAVQLQNGLVTPTGQVYYYGILDQLVVETQKIQEERNTRAGFFEIAQGLNQRGIFHWALLRDLFAFLLFQIAVAWVWANQYALYTIIKLRP